MDANDTTNNQKDHHLARQQEWMGMDREERAVGSWASDRGLSHYTWAYGFKKEELKDKLILDVGAGWQIKFAREAKEYGGKVISLSPAFAYREHALTDPHFRKDEQKPPKELPPEDPTLEKVAAYADNLPFPNNKFDMTLSSYAVSFYTWGEERTKSILEMIRVTKTGGIVGIDPLDKSGKNTEENILNTLTPEIVGLIVERKYEVICPHGVAIVIVKK